MNKVQCIVPPGLSNPIEMTEAPVTLMAGNAVVATCEGCNLKFTYELPTVLKVTPSRGPTSGGDKIKISGSTFAGGDEDLSDDNLPMVHVGNVPCTDVQWASRTQITCKTPPGKGPGPAPVDITVRGYRGPSAFAYTYDAPTVTAVEPADGPSYGGQKITIIGQNFGSSSDEINIFIGGLPCTEVNLVDSTKV